jgi:pectate lyase
MRLKPGCCLLAGLISISVLFDPSSLRPDSIPAFPGAEGFGADTPGGRGGRVIRVTNLNPDGPGSLQEACSASGPRIVVFAVSGVIPGDVEIRHGQISILGQTAPGAGITIKGMLATQYGAGEFQDIVVRFLRVRPNPSTGVSGDAIQFSDVRRVVLDHISCSWSSDEVVDIYGAKETTVQWCAIEESDLFGHPEGPHNLGLINGPDGIRTSFHHNLFAHQRRRCPAVANGPSDTRNNVVYNFRDGFLHDNPTNGGGFNIIGNYYKRGPSDPQIFPFCFQDTTEYFLRDNYIEEVGLIQDPWAEKAKIEGMKYYAKYGRKAKAETVCPSVTTQPPLEALGLVLKEAGCFPRDTVSRRTVNEVRAGTGYWGRHDSGDLLAGLVPVDPPADSDRDGLPDSWELARGLDPRDSTDNVRVLASGYMAIEEYANALAQKMIRTGGDVPFQRLDFDGDLEFGLGDATALVRRALRDPHDPQYDLDGDGRFGVRDVLKLLIMLRR